MNERIRELLVQSGLLDYTKIVVPEHEKFAELIVRECANWMENGPDENGDRIGDSFYWSAKMRLHFGVEE